MGTTQELALQSTLAAAVLGLLATLTGLPFARLLGLGPLALTAAPVLGLSLHAVSAAWVFLAAPPTRLSAALHAATLLGATWGAACRFGTGTAGRPRCDEGAVSPTPGAILRRDHGRCGRCGLNRSMAWLLLASLPLGAVATADAWPRWVDGGLYLHPAMHDHARIVFIDAIARGGLPPDNPLYAPGRAVNLGYYYLWPLLAAEAKWLVGVSGWAADLGLSWVTFSAVLSLVAGMAAQVAGRVQAGALALSLSLTGALLPLVPGTGLAEPGGFAPLLQQVRWAPHHVLGAGALLLLVYLIALERISNAPGAPFEPGTAPCDVAGPQDTSTVPSDGQGDPGRRQGTGPHLTGAATAVAMACLAAFAAGSSGWLAVAFALASPLLALYVLRQGGPRLLLRYAAIALAAVALVAPLVLSVSRSPCGHRGEPLALSLLPAVRTTLLPALQALLYWVWFLPWALGPLFLLGLAGLFHAARHVDARTPRAHRSLLRLATILVVAMLLVCQVVRSALINNDLGWRANLLPQLLLIVWGAVALFRWGAQRRALPLVAGALLLCLGWVSAVRGLPVPDPTRGAAASLEAHRAFAGQARAFAALRAHTEPDERVLSNPHGFEDMLPWPINIDFLLFADRDSAFAHPHWVVTYCPGEDPKVLRALHRLTAQAFTAPRAIDLHRLREGLGVDALLVTARDRSFRSPVYEQSGAFRLVQSDPAFAIYRATTRPPTTRPPVRAQTGR